MSAQNELESTDERTIVRYLLDDLTEANAYKIEERYFCDQGFFAHVRAIETKLIETYSAGSMNEPDKILFERKYLSVPALRAKVASIQQRSAVEGPGSKRHRSSVWTLLLSRPAYAIPAFASLLLIIGIGYWVNTQTSGSQTAKSQNPPPATSSGPAPESIFALVLSPGLLKSTDEPQTVPLLPSLKEVQLTLELPSLRVDTALSVELLRVEAKRRVRVWARDGFYTAGAPGGRILRLTISATDLRPGDYLVYVTRSRASPTDALESYGFSVERKPE